MNTIKNNLHDREEGSRGELLREKDNEEELAKVLELKKEVFDTRGLPPAKSFSSTGRGCPSCKNTLSIKELNEEGDTLWLFCKHCKKQYSHHDLENTSYVGDHIHRQISDSRMLYLMNHNDRTK